MLKWYDVGLSKWAVFISTLDERKRRKANDKNNVAVIIHQLVSDTYKPREVLDQNSTILNDNRSEYMHKEPSVGLSCYLLCCWMKKSIFIDAQHSYIFWICSVLTCWFAQVCVYFRSSSLMAACPKEAILVSSVLFLFYEILSLWNAYSLELNRSLRITIVFLPSISAVNLSRQVGNQEESSSLGLAC
jgi:hypothetical protein